MSRSPRVLAVVVHYGPLAMTLRSLRALDRVRAPGLTIALVDNAGWGPRLAPGLAGLRRRPVVLPMGGNTGFAVASNRGIRLALTRTFDFAWLVNNDAEPEPASLAALLREMARSPRIGIAGSRIHDNDRPPKVWHAGGLVDRRTGATRSIGTGEPDRGQYAEARDVDYVAGCSLLARSEMLREIGTLDERYIMYYEETDLCLRARAAGWRVRYVPASRVRHLVAGRESSGDWRWLYFETRNRLLFVRRHLPGRLGGALVRAWRWPIGSSLLRARPRAAWAALRGYASFLGLALTGRTGARA